MTKLHKELRALVVAKYGTLGAFADALGVSKQMVSQKFNNRSGFSKKNIVTWSNILGIDYTDPYEVVRFFML